MLTEFYHHKIKPNLPAYAFNKHYWLFLLWGPVVFALIMWAMVHIKVAIYYGYYAAEGESSGYFYATHILVVAAYFFVYLMSNLCDMTAMLCFVSFPKARSKFPSLVYFVFVGGGYAYWFFNHVGWKEPFQDVEDYFHWVGVAVDFVTYFFYKLVVWVYYMRNKLYKREQIGKES